MAHKLALFSLFLLLAPGLPAVGGVGGVDVRIGTDTDAEAPVFDFDIQSGNYFALIRWNDAWSLFVSSDSGASWNRTIWVGATQGIASVDMAIGGAYVYVAYVTNLTLTKVTIRRFFASTGLADLDYRDNPHSSSRTLFDATPQSVTSVAMETDVDSTDEEIYCAFHLSDGTARFLSDDSIDGTTFSETDLTAGNAAGELDLHWNPGFDTYSLFLSFVDQSGNVQIWQYDGAWSHSITFPFPGSQPRAPISAFGDQVAVAYQAAATNGQGIRYRLSHDGGVTWGPSLMIDAPSVGEGDLSDVDLTARGGLGLSIVYNQDSGANSSTHFRRKPSYLTGPWTDRRSFNDFDSSPGRLTAINWIPSDEYGAIYVGGEEFIPYFDLLESAAIFLDGFESGSTSAWDESVPTS